jgi:hypothetical protein
MMVSNELTGKWAGILAALTISALGSCTQDEFQRGGGRKDA